MEYNDITKVGIGGLKGLPGINNQPSKLEQKIQNINNLRNSGYNVIDIYSAPAIENIGMRLVQSDFGKSKYDEDIYLSQLDELPNIRGERQPWYAQLGAGISKGVVLAGTTYLEGILGLISGLSTGIYNLADENENTGFWEGLFNNEIDNGLSFINEKMEEWLPNYYTDEERNNPWYKNLDTMNFWADSFIKNTGFTVGAFYSGGTIIKVLKGLRLLKNSAMGARLAGSFFSALNEGRIEANHNFSDIKELEYQKLQDAYYQYIENNNLTIDDVVNMGDDKNPLYVPKSMLDFHYNEMQNIENRAANAGVTTMIGNTAFLMLDNLWTFGKLYSRGFDTAKDAASKGVKKAAVEGADEVAEGIKKSGSKYAFDKTTLQQSIGKGLTTGLIEGNEELFQRAIATTSGEWNMYDSPDAYYEAMINPDSDRKTQDFMSSVIKGMADSYGNMSAYEEFAVGFLTGVLGIPTFGKVNNADANTWLGQGKSIGLSGGIFGQIKYDNWVNQKGAEAVQYMNNFVDKVNSKKRYFVQSQSFTDAMDGFAAADNRFEYKNAEDNDVFAAISRFSMAGRLEDLKELVGQDFENISDEELEKIALFTSTNSSNDFRWKNADGTLKSSTPEGREEMRKDLIKKRDETIKEIGRYEESLSIARSISNNALDEDKINELAWLNWKIGKFDDRFKSIKENTEGILSSLSNGLLNFRDTIDVNSEEGKKWIDSTNKLIDFVSYIQGAKNSIDLGIRANINNEFIEFLSSKEVFDYYADNVGITYDQYKKTMESISDSAKLASAAIEFNKKFKEYAEDPLSLEKNREKIEDRNKEKKEISDINKTIEKINNSSVSELVDSDEFSELDLDSMFETIEAKTSGSEEDIQEAKNKVSEANKIKKTNDKIAGPSGILNGIAREEPEKEQAVKDAKKLISKSKKIAENEDEFLDLESEVFNNIGNLFDEEDEQLKELEGKEEEIKDILSIRLDNAKSVIEQAKSISEEIEKQLDALPSTEDVKNGKVRKSLGEVGHDKTEKTEEVKVETKEKESNAYELVTPVITKEKVLEQSSDFYDYNFNAEEETNTYEYWKPTTTQFPIHKLPGDDRPFYQIVRDNGGKYLYHSPSDRNKIIEIQYTEEQINRMEIVYKYLDSHNTFDYVNRGEIKAKDTVHFFTDFDLNKKAGEIVILMKDDKGRIIGDLMSKNSRNFKQQLGLPELVEKLEKEVQDYLAINDEVGILEFSDTTTISKMMVGKVPYTNNESSFNSLNSIFGNTSFKLGIAATSGRNANIIASPGRKRNQGQSNLEMAIMSPLNSTAGQPYLLLDTSRKYKGETVRVTVPFILDTFGIDNENSSIGKIINEILNKISKAKNNDDLAKIKIELQEFLYLPDFHINFDNNGVLRIHNKAVGAKSQDLLFSGNPNNNTLVDTVIKKLHGTSFQVSRKYINTTYKGQDYNRMIGELSKTNLPIGTRHTVNDWFTINPIIESKETKATNPKSTNSKSPEVKIKEASKLDITHDYSTEELNDKAVENGLLASAKRKKIWEILTDAQKQALLSKPIVSQKQLMSKLELSFKPKDNSFNPSRLGGTLDDVLNIKHREQTSDNSIWDRDKELKWIHKVLPNLSSEEQLRVIEGVEGLIPIGNTGRFAYGRFRNGIIEIAKNASKGTVYHEAFHAVTHTLLTKEEINTLFEEAKNKFGDLTKHQLEEKLAEDFRKYTQIEESIFFGNVVKIFRRLKHFIKNLFGKESYIDNLYYRINRGKLSNRSVQTIDNDVSNYRINIEDFNLEDIEIYEYLINKEVKEVKEDISKINSSYKILTNDPDIKNREVNKQTNQKSFNNSNYPSYSDAMDAIPMEYKNLVEAKEYEGRYYLYVKTKKQVDTLIIAMRYNSNKIIKEYSDILGFLKNNKDILASKQLLEEQDTYYREVEQYHKEKMFYNNLDKEVVKHLNDIGIDIQTYNNMSLEEKEVLLRCL